MDIKNASPSRTILIPVRKKLFFAVRFFFAIRTRFRRMLSYARRAPYPRLLFMKGMNDWSIGIYTGESPVDLRSSRDLRNPVITARDVTDVRAAFVADPFMMKKDARWYMFFEVFNIDTRCGEIGLAVSDDGFTWNYQQIIVRESFHLSYPFVFAWQGKYYMIPESSQDGSVRLYQASGFPTHWSYVKTLLAKEYVDTGVFRHQGTWWMFTGDRNNNALYLYYAHDLMGPWIEHPRSPIVNNNAHIARPGGRSIEWNGRIIRYAQDNSQRYGGGVRAFEITVLSTTQYEECEIEPGPIIQGSGTGWNKKGMHTIDPHCIAPHEWIAAVDGFNKDLLLIRY